MACAWWDAGGGESVEGRGVNEGRSGVMLHMEATSRCQSKQGNPHRTAMHVIQHIVSVANPFEPDHMHAGHRHTCYELEFWGFRVTHTRTGHSHASLHKSMQ